MYIELTGKDYTQGTVYKYYSNIIVEEKQKTNFVLIKIRNICELLYNLQDMLTGDVINIVLVLFFRSKEKFN